MSQSASVSSPRIDTDLFRRGLLGMGWSPAELAKTVFVPEEIVLEWQNGDRPIPSPVLDWVAMYVRHVEDTDETELLTTHQ